MDLASAHYSRRDSDGFRPGAGIRADKISRHMGFALFGAGFMPTLITDLTVGSSIDRSGQLGITLWKHHFRHTITSGEVVAALP